MKRIISLAVAIAIGLGLSFGATGCNKPTTEKKTVETTKTPNETVTTEHKDSTTTEKK